MKGSETLFRGLLLEIAVIRGSQDCMRENYPASKIQNEDETRAYREYKKSAFPADSFVELLFFLQDFQFF